MLSTLTKLKRGTLKVYELNHHRQTVVNTDLFS